MPLPLLLIAGAAVAGTIGATKTIDAVRTQSKADDINESAQDIVDKAKEYMELSRKQSEYALKSLGQCKVDVLNESITAFINDFKKIKNIPNSNSNIDDKEEMVLDNQELEELKDVAMLASSLLQGAAGGAVGGAIVAFGAYNAAMALATASTGTAIAGLSGAAATNATLAFFGGGSLAAGGFGVVGGTAVLGGLVAGPALVILGVVASSKANANLEDARSNLAKAKAFEAEIKAAVVESTAIRRTASMLTRVLISLDIMFKPLVLELHNIISNSGVDYAQFSLEERESIRKAASLARAIKSVLDVSVLTEDGKHNPDAATVNELLPNV